MQAIKNNAVSGGVWATWLLFVVVTALSLRISPVFIAPENIRDGLGPFGDSILYHKIAYNLTMGNGYSGIDDGRAMNPGGQQKKVNYEPAITRGPVYPMFLATIYKTFGKEAMNRSVEDRRIVWNTVRVVQSVLDAFLCLLLYWLLRKLYPQSQIPAFFASAIYALCFYNIYYARMLLSESVTTFLVTSGIVAAMLGVKYEKSKYWFVFGLSMGLASLSRPEYILFPFFMIGWMAWLHRSNIRKTTKGAALLLLGLVLILAPWTLRNAMVYKRFIPTSAGAIGLNLFLGTFENADWQGWRKSPAHLFQDPQTKKKVEDWGRHFGFHMSRGTYGAHQFDNMFKKLAIQTIRDNPLETLRVWTSRLPRLWYQNYIKMYAYREPSGIWFLLYMGLSVLALVLLNHGPRRVVSPIVLLFVYLNLVYLPLHIEPRYGVTVYPGLCILSGIGGWELIARVKKWRS